MSVELALRKKKYLLKAKVTSFSGAGISNILRRLSTFISKDNDKGAYLIKLEALGAKNDVSVQVNSPSDLLDYASIRSGPTRWEFLEGAMRRLESGERCYTWSEQGRLLACAWLAGPKTPRPQQVPEGAPVLHGIYCHPEARGELSAFLKAAARQAVQEEQGEGTKDVYACIGDNDLRQALEK